MIHSSNNSEVQLQLRVSDSSQADTLEKHSAEQIIKFNHRTASFSHSAATTLVSWWTFSQRVQTSPSALITASLYLIRLLPTLGAATLRGPQVTAPPLHPHRCQVALAPGGHAFQMAGCHSTPLSGKGGTPGDRSVIVPLARPMLALSAGLL